MNAARRLRELYERLYSEYGPQYWWPGDTPWEICVGAILTQNTNWGNVEKAIENLKSNNFLKVDRILGLPSEKLSKLIKPSGYFNLKAARLKAFAYWWKDNVIEDDHNNVKLNHNEDNLEYWREAILKVNGVGPETADTILLYAFGFPTFVIDAYTRRIMARHYGTDEKIDYHELRLLFMSNLPQDVQLFNEYHALFVKQAKKGCLKAKCTPDCILNE